MAEMTDHIIDSEVEGGLAHKATPKAGSNQFDNRIAKKYPMAGKLKGSYYGNPEISSILAGFESHLLSLHGSRPYYKPTSKAWYKHQDRIRLEAAQKIMDALAQEANKARAEAYDQALYDSGYLESQVGPKTKELVISTREKLRQLTADKEQGSMNTIKLDNSDFTDFTDETDDEDNY